MSERMNDFMRALIGMGLGGFGAASLTALRLRVARHRRVQASLRRRYGIEPHTPIHRFDECRARIQAVREKLGDRALDALTSGSTHEPKRLVYSRARLRATHLAFSETYSRLFLQLGMKRKSFFVFSPLGSDSSLTSLMLDGKPPPRMACLQTPHRIQGLPALKSAAADYGDTAVRLWMLANADPGMLYATNPSTLATFMSELTESWDESRALVRDHRRNPELYGGALTRAQRLIEARGASARLERIAGSDAPLPAVELFPSLSHFSCWDGGYVRTFLEQVHAYLPSCRFIPMYSMSTETIETITCLAPDGSFAFLPLAPGVVYEFLPLDADDRAEALLPPHALTPGELYTLVVSDAYGLLRYQTEDVFLCQRMVAGLPDLRFQRRRNLSYSFTGEKLTGEQASAALRSVQAALPALKDAGYLSLLPAHPPGDPLPHYKVVLIQSGADGAPKIDLPAGAEICRRVEAALSELNGEFRAKLSSRRLGGMQFVTLPIRAFVKKLGGDTAAETWEAQFKFLPLYAKRWEELG